MKERPRRRRTGWKHEETPTGAVKTANAILKGETAGECEFSGSSTDWRNNGPTWILHNFNGSDPHFIQEELGCFCFGVVGGFFGQFSSPDIIFFS